MKYFATIIVSYILLMSSVYTSSAIQVSKLFSNNKIVNKTGIFTNLHNKAYSADNSFPIPGPSPNNIAKSANKTTRVLLGLTTSGIVMTNSNALPAKSLVNMNGFNYKTASSLDTIASLGKSSKTSGAGLVSSSASKSQERPIENSGAQTGNGPQVQKDPNTPQIPNGKGPTIPNGNAPAASIKPQTPSTSSSGPHIPPIPGTTLGAADPTDPSYSGANTGTGQPIGENSGALKNGPSSAPSSANGNGPESKPESSSNKSSSIDSVETAESTAQDNFIASGNYQAVKQSEATSSAFAGSLVSSVGQDTGSVSVDSVSGDSIASSSQSTDSGSSDTTGPETFAVAEYTDNVATPAVDDVAITESKFVNVRLSGFVVANTH